MEELTRFVYTVFLALNFLPLAVEMTSTFQGQGTFYMGELSSAFKRTKESQCTSCKVLS